MANTNLFDQGLESPPVTKTTPTASGNLFDQGLTGGGGVSPSVPESPSSSVSSNLFDAGVGRPNNGQPVPAPPAQDENQPWYKKDFDWANTPLVDFNHAMSPEGAIGHAFGRTSEAGGFERGVENIVSGLTSPLSVALTAGTFGTGGLLESAGATALKEAGGEFAENLPQIMKAAKIATDAYKEGNAADPVINAALEAGGHDLDLVRRGEQVFSPLNKLTELGSDAEQLALSKQGLSREEQAALGKGELSADARNEIAEKNGGFTDEQLKALKAAGDEAKKAQAGFTPVDDAIKAAGVDPALWNRAQKFLYDNGLTEHSLLGGDFLDRGAFQILRKTAPGWSIATTARAAETAKSIMSAGFTLQQLESASAMSPRFLDALKEGDTDKAWEYGTEMFASGTLGILGASHALHSAGELFKPLIENDAFRPNDHWLQIDRANKEREALHTEGDQHAINLDEAVRKILGHAQPGFLETVFGGSKEVQAQKNLELATVFHQIVTGGDRVKAAQWYNALSEALGREDRLPVPGESGPNNGQVPPPQRGPLPKVGEPIEVPSRDNTEVVRSNDSGQVRVGADGRPVVWLSPEAWDSIVNTVSPNNPNFSGFSFDAADSAQLEGLLPKDSELQDLVSKARQLSKQNLLTAATTDHPQMIRVVSEELHHTAQRELSPEGSVENHLDPEQFSRLRSIIPTGWTTVQDRLGYDKDPAVRVVETAAQFMAERYLDEPGAVTKQEADDFLKEYFKELVTKYGPDADKIFNNINEISQQHVEDINAAQRLRTSQAGVSKTLPKISGSLPEGPGKRNIENKSGNTGRENGPKGLASRERENQAPAWYLKSTGLINQRMQGPMPADTVLKMLENNGVKPDELKYTGLSDLLREKGQEKVSPEEVKKFLDANNLQIQEVTYGGTETKTLSQVALEKYGKSYHELPSAQQAEIYGIVHPENEPEITPTKFETYQLPGGQNYREMLLTLPSEGPHIEERYGKYEVIMPNGGIRGSYYDRGDAERALRFEGRQGGTTFTSSHWDEPNVVGHVRFNDRTGPNGEKLLHLEELQSDWHQKGRTAGYRGEPTAEDIAKYGEAQARSIQNTKIPDAPFKKTWPELLMKRMVRYASENGYDGISWTPGEEQAARYDLSKQLDSIRYAKPDSTGGKDLSGKYEIFGSKDGGDVLHRWVSEEELPDFVGKDVAKRIISGEGKGDGRYKALSGVDLKVGGEGMKGFYDKIVPEVANRLGKQFGSKVRETDVSTLEGEPKIRRNYDTSPASYFVDVPGGKSRGFETEEEAKKYVEEAKAVRKSVPYFPITDSMRESVMKQGQPLFARESPNNGQDPQLAHQIDTNVFKNQPKDYQDLVMESLRRNAAGELSDREIAASKKLREEDGRNYEIGSANDLIHTFLENHLHRIYEEDNPKGKVILSNAKAGKFATNVSQARQQVYDSQLTALLKSPKKIMLDPIKAVSMDRGDLIKAAANRQLIDNLRDKFTRASDGRPAVVLSGSGQPITGKDGEDPRIFIDPNRVRKIGIAPDVVKQLIASGDLQRFLDSGTIREVTPYVRSENIGAAIDRLHEEAQRKTPIDNGAPVGDWEHLTLRKQIETLEQIRDSKNWGALKDFNDALEKKYAWDPQDYVSLANNAMKGWNFITNSPDGTPVYVRSDIKVHPEFAEYLQNRLGLKESDISKNPVGKALLGAGTKLKHTLLSLSPFHLVQEALRGIMVGVNPFHITGPDILTGERVDPSDPNSPTIIRKLVENNFTTGTDYKAQQSSSEGLSSGGGLLNKAPGVGKVIGNSLNWYQDFLFKRYIPALKARAGELLFHEYQRLHPDWSVDRVAKAAALHANDTFGGINWKAMGRSATTQDWGRLMFLAPDWLESEMRSGARLFNKDEGGLGRAQVAKMALGLWGIARVLNLVTTGNAHYEAPFGLATKNKEGKETVFSIRTLPTDLLHAASDPVGFVKGRLSPTVHAGEELVSGRDQFGRKLQPSDLWVDVLRNMSPIPLQAVGQAISGTGPEIGNIGQAVKAVGGTAQTYRTPAQKMAADLAANHSESGPIDPAQMARHHRILQLEDQARAGEISWPDLYKLTYATDQLHPDELKKIETNVKETKGMDPGLAALYSRASRLPAKEYLDLLDVMNSSERTALVPLTRKVQKRYLNKAKKDETPEERAKDPTFQRFLRMIPGQHPGPISQATPPIPAPVQQEAAHLYSAINPTTGHRIVHNGSQWLDAATGEAISA